MMELKRVELSTGFQRYFCIFEKAYRKNI